MTDVLETDDVLSIESIVTPAEEAVKISTLIARYDDLIGQIDRFNVQLEELLRSESTISGVGGVGQVDFEDSTSHN